MTGTGKGFPVDAPRAEREDRGAIYSEDRARHWDEWREAGALGSSCGKTPEQAKATTWK
jgi:hypothetical protein